MNDVLLVDGTSGAPALERALSGMLRRAGFGRLVRAGSGAQGRRQAGDGVFGLVLVGAPLADEAADALAADLAERLGAMVIMLAPAEHADAVADHLLASGVMVLARPLNRTLLEQTVLMAAAAQQRMAKLQRANEKLTARLDELRLVDRAKCALIQYRQLTEPQAHHYIEKQAMDSRTTRREVARDILRTFEGPQGP